MAKNPEELPEITQTEPNTAPDPPDTGPQKIKRKERPYYDESEKILEQYLCRPPEK
jgi:hypothetical protein